MTLTITARDAQTWEIAAVRASGGETKRTTAARRPASPWIGADDPGALVAEMQALRNGKPVPAGAPERIGQYLHSALLPSETWKWVLAAAGDEAIELAFDCPGDAAVLRDLPWELLHTGQRYLGLLPERPCVVTRVIRSTAKVDPSPRRRPPTVLFAVGAELTDPSVRAGAEFMGLMRELRRADPAGGAGAAANGAAAGDVAIEPHVLDGASLRAIAERAHTVSPDVVYLVGHGRANPSEGTVMELRDSDDPSKARAAGPDQIVMALKKAAEPPALVIVSACDGAVALPGMTASLASTLVENGLAVVVAMAGRITDQACRMFMRAFVAALMDGTPMVDAVATGRRAAFWQRGPGADAADWAMPCVFVASGMPERYRAVAGRRERTPGRAAAAMGLVSEDEGVFCGRREFFRVYAGLVAPGEGKNTVVITTDDVPGLGRRRLLREIAAQALRDGHVPCLLESDPRAKLESTRDLAVRALKWMVDLRAAMGLRPDLDPQLLKYLGGQAPAAQDDDIVELLVEIDRVADLPDEVPPARVRGGLAKDLNRLVADARDQGWPPAGAHSRPLVLLRGIGTWGNDLLGALGALLSKDGIGVPNLPVPVIATWRRGSEGDGGVAEWRDSAPNLHRFVHMGPFSQDSGEDLLAYEWTLLNPVDPAAPVHAVLMPDGLWLDHARGLISGVPTNLSNDGFWKAVTTIGTGIEPHGLREGDDAVCLERYTAQGMLP